MWQDIIKRQFKYRIRKNEIVLEECPYCHNTRFNLEIHQEKGIWKCWACQKSGKIEKFFKDQQLAFEKTLWASSKKSEIRHDFVETLDLTGFRPVDYEEHKKFLSSRGLVKEDVYKYNLLTTNHGKYKSKLIVPLKEGKEVVYFVGRDMFKGGRYYNPHIDKKSLLLYYLGVKNRLCLYVVEGVFDAFAVNKLGFSVCVLLGSGMSKEQISKIKRIGFDEVIICLDGDLQKSAIELCEKISKREIRCRVVLISEVDEDPNSLYVKNPDYLLRLLENPKEVTLARKVEIALRKCK